jgi:hypothetical protein
MPLDRIEFVDSISDTATVRLSLSAAPLSVLVAGTEMPPPTLRRVTVNTLLTDGSIIPAAAYDNRTLTIHVQCEAATPALAAQYVQRLNQELDRTNNILRWQPEPSIPPVYFKTFRAPDYTQDIDHGINLYDFYLVIQAEPFAYGTRESSPSTVTIQNDPAAGSNGKFFEITGVKGDVETPMMFTFGGGINSRQSLFGMRRKGTPSQAPLFLQAEAMTLGTDTTTAANNAAYSGSGNNTAVTTFSSSNDASVARLTASVFPTGANVDVRGTYRVFARVNASTTGGTFFVRVYHGQRNVIQDSSNIVMTSVTNPRMIDLGLIQLPEGFDPVSTGPTGAPIPVAGTRIQLGAQRLSGSGSLIWDYLMFVPADDRLCLVNWWLTSPTSFVLDGYSRSIYGLNGSGQIVDVGPVSFTGDIPYVAPGVTNRFVYINDVTPNPVVSDAVSGNCTLDWAYWPRYLYVRPVSS